MHEMHTEQTPNEASLAVHLSERIMDSVSRGRLRHCEKTRKVRKERERNIPANCDAGS